MREILAMVAITGAESIVHPDSPIEEGVPGNWIPAGSPQAWTLPSDLCLTDEATAHWLFSLDNWTVLDDVSWAIALASPLL